MKKSAVDEFEFPELPPNWYWYLGELQKVDKQMYPKSHMLILQAKTGVPPNDWCIFEYIYIDWNPNSWDMVDTLVATVEKASTSLSKRVWDEINYMSPEQALIKLYRKANMTQDLTTPDQYYDYDNKCYSDEPVTKMD